MTARSVCRRVTGTACAVLAMWLIATPSVALAGNGMVTEDLTGATTAEDLVTTLLGGGIDPSNITVTGPDTAAGLFSGGTGRVGFESGVVLCSGNLSDVPGPNSDDGTTGALGFPGDADLDSLIPGFSTFDATILEFDFVPTSSLIVFQYVFGSEEYNEFTNSEFNDVFGFFVNGTNQALLPDGVTPVSINNVNGGNPVECLDFVDNDSDALIDVDDPDCTVPGDNIVGEMNSNSGFFINNDCSDPDGGPPCPIDIELDGLTTVLTLVASVNANQINTIKLAIADAGDSVLDSCVFLEAQSVVSVDEICDGLDNDNDKLIDEDLGTTTCGIGACQVTVDNCVGGQEQQCMPGSPVDEACDNGIDDDCDGLTDGEDLLDCPQAEVCDGQDNDNDGMIDENLGETTCGLGECENTVANCLNGETQTCDPFLGATAEICDTLDNDCDGGIDEGLGILDCGVGACANSVPFCLNGQEQVCEPGDPVEEICDNEIDDDCDGLTDAGDVDDCEPLLVILESFNAEPYRGGVLVTWVTSAEIDNVGFRLLRSTDGGTTREVRSGIIAARGSELEGAAYKFRDWNRQTTGRTFYYLEDIDVFGQTTVHGPVVVEAEGLVRRRASRPDGGVAAPGLKAKRPGAR